MFCCRFIDLHMWRGVSVRLGRQASALILMIGQSLMDLRLGCKKNLRLLLILGLEPKRASSSNRRTQHPSPRGTTTQAWGFSTTMALMAQCRLRLCLTAGEPLLLFLRAYFRNLPSSADKALHENTARRYDLAPSPAVDFIQASRSNLGSSGSDITVSRQPAAPHVALNRESRFQSPTSF